MMNFRSSFLFLICAGLLGAETLLFLNGDRLAGEPSGLGEEELAWKSKVFSGDLSAPLKELDKVLVSDEEELPSSAFSNGVTVHMNRGDIINGHFKGISEDSLLVDTDWAGELSLRRSMIRKVYFKEGIQYFLESEGDIDDWQEVTSRKKWLQTKNGIGVRGRGAVCRKVEIDSLFSASFKLKMQESPRMRMLLLATEGQVYEPESYLEIVIQRRNILARVRTMGDLETVGQYNSFTQLDEKNSADFSLYVNLKKQEMAIYVNGNSLAEWSLPEGVELGNWVYLYSEYDGDVVMENFSMRSWNGALPTSKEKKNTFMPQSTKPLTLLENGDAIDGHLREVVKKGIILETELGEVTVPLNKLREVDYSRTAYDEAKREKRDVMVRLRDGSKVTLSLESWENGFIRGRSQQYGEITASLEEVHDVSFNIYRD